MAAAWNEGDATGDTDRELRSPVDDDPVPEEHIESRLPSSS